MEEIEEKAPNFEEMSNNSLLFYLKQLEADFEAVKLRMLKEYDKMEEIERTYEKANKILLKRLKGE